MNSTILSLLDIEMSRLFTNKIINLCTTDRKEPFGFVELKNDKITAHFGYCQNPNYTKHTVPQ